jgi:membrane-bound lytic murein transglycosylase D
MHPERYNLRLPPISARGGQITLKRPASIAELTVCLGQDGNPRDGWFRALRNLNPQLDPQEREPIGARIAVPLVLEDVYTRNCANGRWAQLADELHAAAVPAPPPIALAQRDTKRPKARTHVVRKGETLSSISRKSECGSVADIAAVNRLRAPRYALKVGQKLTLPRCSR